jgi:Uma2 family endonuclease
MVALINDRDLERRLIRHRQRIGADRYDEVWEGVYYMSPMADNQHQGLSFDLSGVFGQCVDARGLGRSFAGVNVSDREDDWKQNYRVPDLAVFLNGTTAVEHRAFWYGGPDFALEIASRNDRSDEKIPFYEKVGTKDLLIIDRRPWALRLYRRVNDRLELVGTSTLDSPALLRSEVIPLSFQLETADGKAIIRLTHNDGAPAWTVRPRDLPKPRPKRRK